jgi:hypothetical protein
VDPLVAAQHKLDLALPLTLGQSSPLAFQPCTDMKAYDLPRLHEDVVTVSFTLKNNGTIAGHEVWQQFKGKLV